MKRIWWLIIAVVSIGCSTSTSPTYVGDAIGHNGVTASASVGTFTLLSTPSPIWKGTTLASDGVGGVVTLTFGEPSTVVWTGPTGTSHGVVTGALPTLTITGSDNTCSYTAVGTVVGNVFSGTYTLTGACVDGSGVGTFTVTNEPEPIIDPIPPIIVDPIPPTTCGNISYWRMNQGGNNDNPRKNACENRGGVWLNDFNIPGDNTETLQPDVCKFSPNPPGNPGNDITLYDPPGLVPLVCVQ